MSLPTGTATHQGLVGGDTVTLLFDQGFEWSIINAGTTAITLGTSLGHSITAGSLVTAAGVSARWIVRITAKDTVQTYRLS